MEEKEIPIYTKLFNGDLSSSDLNQANMGTKDNPLVIRHGDRIIDDNTKGYCKNCIRKQ